MGYKRYAKERNIPKDVVSAPLGEVRAVSTAGGGSALTTTATFTSLLRGTNWIRMVPRNAVTAVVVQYALNPWLSVIKTTDALATVAAMTDASENVQDGVVGNVLSMSSFDTLANGDRLYIGSRVPIRGIVVTIGNTNSAGGSTATVKYWQSATPNAWTDITITDGTKSTDTFRQTGNITWTVPADHLRRSLVEINDDLINPDRSGGALTAELTIARSSVPAILREPLFWYRYETSAAFDATVTVTAIQAMNRSTTYDELLISLGMEMRVNRGLGGIGCIEHLTDAGTANLIVSCGALGTGGNLV